MKIIIDEKLFENVNNDYRKEIIEICKHKEIDISIMDIPSLNTTVRYEIVSLVGLAVATSSLIVALLQYLETQPFTISRKEIIDEIEAYLKLKNINDYNFVFEKGFENIIKKNGQPCTIGVTIGKKESIIIYFGVTHKSIWISSMEANWRALT